MASSKSTKQLPGGCLSLFGLPFLAAGIFLSGIYFSGYVKWWNARSWVEIPCWIESTDLKVGETYKAMANYRYEYQGRTYRGDRVSLIAGADNIGDFQQQAHRELSRYTATAGGDPPAFRCFVDPGNPEESVLYRTLRWEMQAFMAIFALTFPAVGAGLVFGGWMGVRTRKREEALRLEHLYEPWRWKAAWADGPITEASNRWRLALHLYTLWSGLVIVPLIAAAAMSGAFQQKSAWLLVIFAAIWCLPLWFSIKRLRHRMAVGNVRFDLRSMPASPGTLMDGDILIEKPLSPLRVPEVRLNCEKLTIRRSSDGDSTHTETVWSHREDLPQDQITRDPGGYRLPVRIQLPPDAPENDRFDDATEKYVWKLHFKVPGTAIHSVFEIPVFRTAQSPSPLAAASPEIPSVLEQASIDLPALLAARRIQATFDSASLPLSIVCPPGRFTSMIVFLVLFNLVWTAAAVFLIIQEAPLLFLAVWILSAAAIWVMGIWMILHTRTVIFNFDGLEIRDRIGPIFRTRNFGKSQITGFSHDSNMSSGNTVFYRVRLESVIGKKLTIVDGFTGDSTAKALIQRLENWRKSSV